MSVGILPPTQMTSPMERNYRIGQLTLFITVENAAYQAGDFATASIAASGARAQVNKAGLDPQYLARILYDIAHPGGEPFHADLDYLKALGDKMSVMGPATPVMNLPDSTNSIAAQSPPSQYSIPQAEPPGGSSATPVAGPIANTPAVGQNQASIYNQGLQAPSNTQPMPFQSASGSYSVGMPEGTQAPPSYGSQQRVF